MGRLGGGGSCDQKQINSADRQIKVKDNVVA